MSSLEDPNTARPIVLVVEDDEDILRILTHMVRNAGYEVRQARGGAEALEMLHASKPDLLLTDLSMPKVSGIDVIRQLRADSAGSRVPCIAVTAHVWDDIARAAQDAGCDGFVFKPFNNRQLMKELRRHLERSADAAPPHDDPKTTGPNT